MNLSRLNQLSLIPTLIAILITLIWPGFLTYSDYIFLLSVLLVGIPHGAVDHLIHQSRHPHLTPKKFYLMYLGLFSLVVFIWLIAPKISFLIFIIISSYHFGQSQLFHLKINYVFQFFFFTSWGVLFLSSLVHFNYTECYEIFASFPWIESYRWMSLELWKTIFYVSAFLTAIGFALIYYSNKSIKMDTTIELLILLVLIFLSAYSNAVFTFALYFGIWHSLRSLILEFYSIRSLVKTKINFIKNLLPFSFLAWIGLFGSYYILKLNFTTISPYMVFIILISALTMPHLVVMNRLYEETR